MLLLLPADLAGFPHLYGPAGDKLQGSGEGSVLGLLHPLGQGLHRVTDLNWNSLLENDGSSVNFLLKKQQPEGLYGCKREGGQL